MTAAIARTVGLRLAAAVPLLVLVSFGLFLLGKASPFDPVLQYVGDAGAARVSTEDLARMRANWGLDQPLLVQYWEWATNLFSGDLGNARSMGGRPVGELIGERLGWTVLLTTVGLAGALLISIPLGTLAARRPGGLVDRAVTWTGYVLEAIPTFWLALAAIAVFALTLGALPSGGLTDAGAGTVQAADVARHLVLPASVLAVSQSPWFILYVRETVTHTLAEDFVTGARARGLPERMVLVRHALRSGLLPLITLAGARIPELITGVTLVEAVFSWPGVAGATVQAALAVDFPLLAALTLLATVTVLLGNLAADVGYTLADPRVRLR
ncbi:ABC transporter permease [Micromonospora polyrhachis]|uniref:Peptide/nickel transport system permease protein n=1 Tax=Micromonospora polyrhachis TaxID=1282883 RepID=A0A7W7SL36_9ACTN|nr:ABC transporter permease [Micromonospora polyrhachis]MBB4956788.1 peptide/nickel transport system permease protein [Micromonospora polyrhachis]